MYSNITHVTSCHFMLLLIFSLYQTKHFSLTPNISVVIKIFSWFFLQSWIIWIHETVFMSCTALWLNRVARFISKKEASFWLSKVFGLEMGTRFFFICVFKTNTANSISKINVLYLRNAIHPLPKVLTILTNSTLRRNRQNPQNSLLTIPAQREYTFRKFKSTKPVTQTSKQNEVLSESCRWWDGSRSSFAEWTAEGGLNADGK